MEKSRSGIDHAVRAAVQAGNADMAQRQSDIVREYLNAYLNQDARAAHPDGKVGDLGQLARNQASTDTRKGFAAEILGEARQNEQAIRDGSAHRVRRTNDNDPLVDLAVLDGHGRRISGMGIQVKIEGRDARETLARLNDPSHRKYLEDDKLMLAIADDRYAALMGDGPDSINAAVARLRSDLQRAQDDGDEVAAQQLQGHIDRNQLIKDKLRKARVTSDEAKAAAEHPKRVIAKEVARNAHEAAAAHARGTAISVGTLSLIQNLVACIQGEKDPAQAAVDVRNTTVATTVFAYATTAVSTVVTGAMKNASSDYTKALGATTLVPAVLDATVDTAKLITALAQGKIGHEEFVDSLVDRNIGALGNLYGTAMATAATASLPLSAGARVATGMVGGTLGYQLAMATYTILKESSRDYQIAKEERIRIEHECAEAVGLITHYRTQLNENVARYMDERLTVFNDAMMAMDAALVSNDPDGFLAANADIQRMLRHDVQFRSQEEFDALMASDEPFVL